MLLAALIFVLPLGAPRAQSVRGAGARPCTDWTAPRSGGGRNFEAEQWILGYMSAINVATPRHNGSLFREINEKAALDAVDSYCAAHPADMLWNAVKSAISEHGS